LLVPLTERHVVLDELDRLLALDGEDLMVLLLRAAEHFDAKEYALASEDFERLEKLARLLTEYCTPVTPGAKVHVKASGGALPFVAAVSRAAIDRGGLVRSQVILTGAGAPAPAQLRRPATSRPDLQMRVEEADIMIAAFGGATPAASPRSRPSASTAGRANGAFETYRRRPPRYARGRDPVPSPPTRRRRMASRMRVSSITPADRPDPVAAWRSGRRQAAGARLRGEAVRVSGQPTSRSARPAPGSATAGTKHARRRIFTCPVETGVDSVVASGLQR
jgi:hypothetical protein